MGIEEGEGESKLSASEKAKLALKDYLKDASFGSVKYQAFFDCYDYEDLLRRHKKALYIDYKNRKEDKINSSGLRIIENGIALLNHDIKQKKCTLPGYIKEFTIIQDLFTKISDSTVTEWCTKHNMDIANVNRDKLTDDLLCGFRNQLKKDLTDRTMKQRPKKR